MSGILYCIYWGLPTRATVCHCVWSKCIDLKTNYTYERGLQEKRESVSDKEDKADLNGI